MKILICTSEYPPNVGGFANVAYNLNKQWARKGNDVTIHAPKKRLKNGLEIIKFWNNAKEEINRLYSLFDVIWCQNPLFSSRVDFDKKKKIICTTHTTYNGRWKHMPMAVYPKEIIRNIYHRHMCWREKECFKTMDNLRFITTTNLTKTELKELGIMNPSVIPNGVDTAKFKPDGKRKEQVCAVSRLVPWKRVDLIVKMANRFGYKTKIAGDGPLLAKLKRMAKSNITFLGKISKARVIRLYQESKAFVSTSEYEGMPLALLEAVSCGCIPLVSDIPGHKELISQLNGETNPNELHRFMKRNYDWSIIADKYLEVFKK